MKHFFCILLTIFWSIGVYSAPTETPTETPTFIPYPTIEPGTGDPYLRPSDFQSMLIEYAGQLYWLTPLPTHTPTPGALTPTNTPSDTPTRTATPTCCDSIYYYYGQYKYNSTATPMVAGSANDILEVYFDGNITTEINPENDILVVHVNTPLPSSTPADTTTPISTCTPRNTDTPAPTPTGHEYFSQFKFAAGADPLFASTTNDVINAYFDGGLTSEPNPETNTVYLHIWTPLPTTTARNTDTPAPTCTTVNTPTPLHALYLEANTTPVGNTLSNIQYVNFASGLKVATTEGDNIRNTISVLTPTPRNTDTPIPPVNTATPQSTCTPMNTPTPEIINWGTATPVGIEGDVRYNTDLHILQYRDTADWVPARVLTLEWTTKGSADGENLYLYDGEVALQEYRNMVGTLYPYYIEANCTSPPDAGTTFVLELSIAGTASIDVTITDSQQFSHNNQSVGTDKAEHDNRLMMGLTTTSTTAFAGVVRVYFAY